jgi:hypothetical protein
VYARQANTEHPIAKRDRIFLFYYYKDLKKWVSSPGDIVGLINHPPAGPGTRKNPQPCDEAKRNKYSGQHE